MKTLTRFMVVALLLVVVAAPSVSSAAELGAVEQALGLSAQPQPDMGPYGCPDDCYYTYDVCLHWTCTIDLLTGLRTCTCDAYGDCCWCAGLPSCGW